MSKINVLPSDEAHQPEKKYFLWHFTNAIRLLALIGAFPFKFDSDGQTR